MYLSIQPLWNLYPDQVVVLRVQEVYALHRHPILCVEPKVKNFQWENSNIPDTEIIMSSSDDDFTKVQNLVRDRKRSRTISNISAATTAAEDENPKKQLCHLCQKESIPDMDQSHQQLLEYDSLRAHYFCLLFSSGLGQSGTESEGKN